MAANSTLPKAVPTQLDEAALSAAFDDFAQDVFRFCYRSVQDRTEAEDLMSTVYLEAWRCRGRAFLVEGSLRPWLLGIAANVVRAKRRALRRHGAMLARFAATSADDVETDHADAVAAVADTPHEQKRLAAAFRQLNPRDRAVAELCLVEEMDVSSAAMALGISESAVKSRLGRSRKRLRALLHSDDFRPVSSLKTLSGHLSSERQLGASTGGLHV